MFRNLLNFLNSPFSLKWLRNPSKTLKWLRSADTPPPLGGVRHETWSKNTWFFGAPAALSNTIFVLCLHQNLIFSRACGAFRFLVLNKCRFCMTLPGIPDDLSVRLFNLFRIWFTKLMVDFLEWQIWHRTLWFAFSILSVFNPKLILSKDKPVPETRRVESTQCFTFSQTF